MKLLEPATTLPQSLLHLGCKDSLGRNAVCPLLFCAVRYRTGEGGYFSGLPRVCGGRGAAALKGAAGRRAGFGVGGAWGPRRFLGNVGELVPRWG